VPMLPAPLDGSAPMQGYPGPAWPIACRRHAPRHRNGHCESSRVAGGA
jgi:hypothetical protein